MADSYFIEGLDGSFTLPFNLGTRGRFLTTVGTPVASANNLTLPAMGYVFPITGSTQLNLLDSTNWTAGCVFYIVTESGLTIKRNQTASPPFSTIQTSTGSDIVTTDTNSFFVVIYDGTQFHVIPFAGSGGGGGSFDMPFTQETMTFNVSNTYAGYACTNSSPAAANLPAAASSAGQIYYAEANGSFPVSVTPQTTDLINGTNAPVELQSGQSALFYSNGVNEISAINYVQLAPMQGTTPSCLSWINGPAGMGGLFGHMQLSSTGGNAITFNGDGIYYDPPVISQTIMGVAGGTTSVSISTQIVTTVICDATVAATTVDIPLSTSIAGAVYLVIKNTGAGNSQTIHPVGGDTIEGSGSDVTLVATHSITLTNSSTGWWIIGTT